MQYISTRDETKTPLTFEQAVLCGLAPDGGLYVPQDFPSIDRETLESWRSLSYPDLAARVMRKFIATTELSNEELNGLVHKTYVHKSSVSPTGFRHPDITPLEVLEETTHSENHVQVSILELFHGPTFAFKDIALQFLGNLFELFNARKSDAKALTILGATSGDTGSSAIYGLKGKHGIEVFILFPNGRVSEIQERQMTTVLDSNIHNVAVEGTFDDCQYLVKKCFADREFKEQMNLGAVNSINWARILAQIVYYVYAYFQITNVHPHAKIAFSVPTGNFGDILAGFYAKKLGVPIDDLIVATNSNDILHRFFSTGMYHRTPVQHTISPSMDICVSSNFERFLFALSGDDPVQLRNWMTGFEQEGRLTIDGELLAQAQAQMKSATVDEQAIQKVIETLWTRQSYCIDPHSAIGFAAGKKVVSTMTPNKEEEPQHLVIVGTAHPGKFLPTVNQAIMANTTPATAATLPPQHPLLAKLMNLETRRVVLSQSEIPSFIKKTVEASRRMKED